MASFDVTFNWILDSEDRFRTYAERTDNNGYPVIAGINAKFFPQQFEEIKAIPQALRGLAVKTFYHVNFWNEWLEALKSDEVAKRVADMHFNGGPAVRYLQHAINAAGGKALTVDGEWGPHTVEEANACDEYQIVSAFKAERVQFYREDVERNPANLPQLKGWLARAER